MLKPNLGRVFSAVGACLLIVTLFVVWYDIDRSAAEGTATSTGWQAFPRLRLAVLGGAILTFITALPRQTRPVLVARVDTGRRVAAAYPGLGGGGGRAPALPPGDGGSPAGAALRVPNEAER